MGDRQVKQLVLVTSMRVLEDIRGQKGQRGGLNQSDSQPWLCISSWQSLIEAQLMRDAAALKTKVGH